MLDIHNYKKRLEKTLSNINNSTEISDENKGVILKFHDNCFAEGLSISKIERYLYDLQRLAKMFNKRLSKATREDLQHLVAEIEKKEWAPNSKQTFKVLIKKFYKGLEKIDERGVYPERVRWLKINMKL